MPDAAKIRFTTSLEGLRPSDLKGFYDGWPHPPSLEERLRVLRGSTHAVLAVERETGRVVGFVNALSDGGLCAFIPLLEVLPEFRGRGIGRELVRRMLKTLDGHYAVDLVCDEDLADFYEPLGFVRGRAMLRRDRARRASAGD